MLDLLRKNKETEYVYNRYIDKSYAIKTIPNWKSLCILWLKETTLSEILKQTKKKVGSTFKENSVENVIDLLQNTISYNIPL